MYVSQKTSSEIAPYEYDREQTLGNPLQGFVTDYSWGEPNNAFPKSMEFRYIPLSALLSAPQTYTYELGLEPFFGRGQTEKSSGVLFVSISILQHWNMVCPLFYKMWFLVKITLIMGVGVLLNIQMPFTKHDFRFISNFGAAYDGDNRIAFVQIGLLGFWGEWHTYPHTDWFADDAFQQDVITAFDQAFDVTQFSCVCPIKIVLNEVLVFMMTVSPIPQLVMFLGSLVKMTDAQATTRWESEPMGGEIYPPLQQVLFTEEYVEDTYQQNFSEAVQTTHMTYLLNYQSFLYGWGWI